MAATFDITVDPARHLIRITGSGFFLPEDVAAFVAERDRIYARHQTGVIPFVTIIDIRAMGIQSQETVALFRKAATRSRNASRRLAIVVDKSLARLQMKRVVEGRDAAFFATVAEAEAWLFRAAAIAA
jgi:hypothetical protein